MNRKWLAVVVLVCILGAAVLPGAVSAGWSSHITCGLGFDSAHDSTECWWRGVYSIPAAGGDATLLVGAYAENWDRVKGSDSEPEALAPVGVDVENLTLSPSAQVSVILFDWLNPGNVLFSFQGTLEGLMAVAGGQIAFDGPHGVVIRIPVSVPAGRTLWVGRMELVQGGYRCHADLYLFQGGSIIVRA